MRRRTRVTALLLPCLLLAGCFEEPVHEDLELRFGERGKVQVELAVTFPFDDEKSDNPVLRSRVREQRRRVLLGEDDWAVRFDRLRPLELRSVFDQSSGTLAEARRIAEVDLDDDPDALARFFSDTLVNAFYAEEEGWAELQVFPLAPGRAGYRQRQRYDRAVEPWSESVAAYLRAAEDLYSHLEEQPETAERARLVFGVLLAEYLREEQRGDRNLLTPEEADLVEAVEGAMEASFGILVVEEREAYSINELSRLVHDPFPARLRVRPAGEVLEVEGFVEEDGGALAVPRISLWDALESLAGTWIEPDPLLLYVRASGGVTGEGGGALDLDEVLAGGLRATAPTPNATDLRRLLAERLEPAPVYRALFRTGEG